MAQNGDAEISAGPEQRVTIARGSKRPHEESESDSHDIVDAPEVSPYFKKLRTEKPSRASLLRIQDQTSPSAPPNHPTTNLPRAPSQAPSDLKPYLSKIALSAKTPFQKRVLTLLCQVPCGQYTTYAAIARHLSSSPRAVGNALKNNPFAPQVPCHRVLASGGGIGGFEGSWGRGGEKGANDDKKRALLRGEGVMFDGRGRVVGKAWEGFV